MTLRRVLILATATSLALAAALSAATHRATEAPSPPALSPEDQADLERIRDLLRLVPLLRGASSPEFREDVARAARFHLLQPDPAFRDDCSGFVSAVFTDVGVPMDGVVASIYDQAVVHEALHWREIPNIGDLVFFDNTTDRNHNGRWDDPQTHIGIVVAVEPDGTAIFAHAGTSSGRKLGRINLFRASETRDADGNSLNSYLRNPSPGDPPTAGYLASELWSAFATVDPRLDWHTPPPPPETWP